MKFPAPLSLNPLDLSRTPRATVRPLTAADLSPTSLHKTSPQSQHDRLVGQTQQWVAQTFFGTLLKQMEDSPFKSDLFSGGRGGQAFSSLYHQELTERIARGAGDKLVNSIVRRIEATAAYQKQQRTSDEATVPPTPPADGGRSLFNQNRNSNRRRHVPAAP
jgi:Rod binding domain-containing protein